MRYVKVTDPPCAIVVGSGDKVKLDAASATLPKLNTRLSNNVNTKIRDICFFKTFTSLSRKTYSFINIIQSSFYSKKIQKSNLVSYTDSPKKR